jgi:hypothetical protein
VRSLLAIAVGLVFGLTLALAAAPSAMAEEFGIVPGGVEVRTLDGEGNPDTAAGAHPNLEISFKLNGKESGTSPRDFVFELDPGLGGDLNAAPACPRPALESGSCPEDTQIGVFTMVQSSGEPISEKLYNLEPAPGQLGALATKPFWKTTFELALRPSDYGLVIQTTEFPQLPVYEGKVELWGVPADHLSPPGEARVPVLTAPTRCGPLKVTFRTRSWEPEAPWLSEQAESEPFTGCQSLPFDPRFALGLDSDAADSPTGANIQLSVPPHEGPDEVASSQIRDVEVDLPPGLTISPGGAEGLEACSDSQFGLGTGAPPTCPFHSRVGSVAISAPAFSEPLSGSVYLAQEAAGERFRLFVAAAAPGTELKLLGQLVADPQTGQLTIALDGLPQLSFTSMSLTLNGGPGALLATPLTCGTATSQASFTPYSGGSPVAATAAVSIGTRGSSPCSGDPPFSPAVVAGSTSAAAGKKTGFVLTLTRGGGEQLVKRFSSTLPAGVDPALRTVRPCSSGAAAAGTCPGSSRIGSAEAEVGSGPTPALFHGDVYLTDPYRGAPFGLAIDFRAAVGPFDLGRLGVRGTLRVDGRTGQVTIATDRLPAIFGGIPLRFKAIGIHLDRGGLIRNPTSCRPQTIAVTAEALDGRTVSADSPFRVRGCQKLGFRPRLQATLTDPAELHRDGHPGLRLGARMKGAGTNLQGFRLLLPRLIAFRGAGLKSFCAHDDAIEGACPRSSQVGTAVARTPLLGKTLRGPVYLAQPEGKGLPDLWSKLGAEGVTIDVQSQTHRQDGRLATEVVNLPDMPLTRFAMQLDGGKHGLFSLREGLCASGHRRSFLGAAAAQGQNGAYRMMRVRLGAAAPCGSRGR